ncbi:MAG: hypothetical protein R2754_01680 [Microthrixaceae bacterium]
MRPRQRAEPAAATEEPAEATANGPMVVADRETQRVLGVLAGTIAAWTVVASRSDPQSPWRTLVVIGGLVALAAPMLSNAVPAFWSARPLNWSWAAVRSWAAAWVDRPLAVAAAAAFALWLPLAWGEAVYLTGDALVWTSLFETIGHELARTGRPSLHTSFSPTGPIIQNVIPASGATVFVLLGALTLLGIPGNVVFALLAVLLVFALAVAAVATTAALGVSARFQSLAGLMAAGSAPTLTIVYGRGAIHELLGVAGVMLTTGVVAGALRGHRPTRGSVAMGVIAGLLLTAHPISFVMGIVWLLGVLVALLPGRPRPTPWQSLAVHGGSVACGALLNAWGLLPFALLGPKTDGANSLARLSHDDYYFFEGEVRPPPLGQLINPLRHELLSTQLPPSFVAVPVGLLVLALVCSIACAVRSRSCRLHPLLPLAALAVPFTLRSELAYAIPLMRLNQYVTRPYIWAAMLAALAVPIAMDRCWRNGRSERWLARILVALVVLECAGMAMHAVSAHPIVPYGFKLGPRLVDDRANGRSHASESFNKGLFEPPVLDPADCSPLTDPARIASASSSSSIPDVQTCAREIQSSDFAVTGDYEFTLASGKVAGAATLALPVATSSDIVNVDGATVLGTVYRIRRDEVEAAYIREAMMVVRPTGGDMVVSTKSLPAERVGLALTLLAAAAVLTALVARPSSSIAHRLYPPPDRKATT